MAHNIENRNGKNSIVYAGETPWHKLGQKLGQAFDAETALREGGLDFTVEKVGLQTVDGTPLVNRFGLRRTDTKDVLGVVTDFYKPLQNREAFGFFDGVFGKGKARYEVAGVLGKGEKVWLLAKLPGDFRVGKEDLVGKWLLLTNGHDTCEPVRAKFTPIRVVCQNTLSAALSGTESEIRVQHIGNVAGKLEIAGKLLKQAGIYFEDVQAAFSGFLRKQLKGVGVQDYALRTLQSATIAPKLEEVSPAMRRAVTRICELHDTGRGSDIKGTRGTLWGAYNAVTEYVDHDRTSDSLAYMATGRGAEIKQRAFSMAVEMAKGAN
jgi:phage/plasmid-like protein (TIGR03299 family)